MGRKWVLCILVSLPGASEAAVVTVSCPSDSLQAKVNAASPGDALTVSGVCDGGASGFVVSKALTIVASGGTGSATLRATNPSGPAILISASNVILDGFIVKNSSALGIKAVASAGSPRLSDVAIRNVQSDRSISMIADRSTLYGCSLNGGSIDSSEGDDLLVARAVAHAITVRSARAQIVDNTVIGADATGISIDGRDNYVGQNRATDLELLGSITPPTIPGGNLLVGNQLEQKGIAVGTMHRGTCVLGNEATGGIAEDDAFSSLVLGNRVHGADGAAVTLGGTNYTYLPPLNLYHRVRRNYLEGSAAILSAGTREGDIAFNFVDAGAATDGGVGVQLEWNFPPPSSLNFRSTPTSGYRLFGNTVRNVRRAHQIHTSTRDVKIYRERYLNSPDHYVARGAGVKWDGQLQMGGSYYEGFAANGNPSNGLTPYTDFIVDDLGTRDGSYADRFPFKSEHLGQEYEVKVLQPVAGVTVAAGSKQVIEWRSKGCVLVDLVAVSGSTSTVIEQDYPDTGFYYWSVPSTQVAGTYQVEVSCLNSVGQAVGAVARGSKFGVSSAELVLLTPNWAQVITGNDGSATTQKVRVSWKKASSVGNVEVYVAVDGGLFTRVMGGTGPHCYVDVVAPNVSSSRVLYRVQDSQRPQVADTSDGYVTVRNATAGTFGGMAEGEDLLMGEVKDFSWTTPLGALTVDLEMYDATLKEHVPVAMGWPACYSQYSMLVDELWGVGHHLRATFRDGAGAVLGTPATSPSFNIRYTTALGEKATFYRLYNDVVKTHLYTTDAYEYGVLEGRGWSGEGAVGQLLDGSARVDGVEAIPYYRLYRWPLTRHFYTSDRYEYYVHRDFGQMNAEGPIGYMFPKQVTGTIPFYRASHVVFPYHLYTTDAYEYSVRTAPGGGWTGEGVVGYIYPKP